MTIKILVNKVLISNSKSDYLVLTFSEFINHYLQQKINEEEIIEEYWGTHFLKRLKILKNYKDLDCKEFLEVTKKRKLGTGSYATVYQYSPKIAVKVIEKEDKVDGKIEIEINELLQNNILFARISPCINMIYQSKSDKKFDYIAIEKGDTSFWYYLENRNSDYDVKGIIFQIIFTLAVIQNVYPKFRHNDLKCDNIILSLKNDEDIYLKKHDSNWKLKDVPLAKITDFDYSNITNLVDNPKIGTKFATSFGGTSAPNKIYDLHLFLNSVYQRIKIKNIKDWIETVIPVKLLKSESEFLSYSRLKFPESRDLKIKTPEKLLLDPFFDEFKVKKKYKQAWGI